MIIPSIDLQGGRVVQLVQGERLALERGLAETLAAFAGFPWLQVIDLDAAKGGGDNEPLLRRLLEACVPAGVRLRYGGGVRSAARAAELLRWGIERVIVSSAAFTATDVNREFLDTLASCGAEAIILAVDARGGRVAVEGWRRLLPLTPVEAVTQATGLCGEFLYTHIDAEGMMLGTSLVAARALRGATARRLSIAGGITTLDEIDALAELGCDAVLGMALYTGKFDLEELRRRCPAAGAGSELGR